MFKLVVETGMQLFGLFIFGLFWLISTPIYWAATGCDWIDKELKVALDEVL